MTSFDELMKEKQEEIYDLKISNKKLKEERDFFKEQAKLWRNDYKNEYEENRKLKDVLESLMKKYKIREIGIGDEVIMKTLEK